MLSTVNYYLSTLLVCTLLLSRATTYAQELTIPPELRPENISPKLSSQTATVNGVELHYVTGGEGPVVLLWHGFLGNWASYRKVLPLLVDNYTVVVPDMRGYGHSEVPDSNYSARPVMEDFHALMRRLGHDEIHIISHDMGAPSALLYASEFPDEVLTLTYMDEPAMLLDTIADKIEMRPEDTHYGGLWWWMMAQSTSLTEMVVLGNERNYIDWYYDNYTMVEGAIDETSRRYFAADLAGKTGVHGWFGTYREVFTTMEQTAPLATNKVTTPILALGAEGSLGKKVGQMLQAVATRVTTEVAPGSGHFIAEEQPEWLVERFNRFVAETSR